ncbi:hypothetical protein QP449_01835 [Staphylococcus hominis]|uniref:hypothetical protein n=1 Tax=Staphylococcus hominis TaxID=1290 RepID=UPI0025544201|nr:hypothetical protein [Staphylococcus hominis]MDK7200930.1 hypothetical protein [Staphylococcus hominis]MEC5415807.1 hypothetical protein [Staphylococcus hominis]
MFKIKKQVIVNAINMAIAGNKNLFVVVDGIVYLGKPLESNETDKKTNLLHQGFTKNIQSTSDLTEASGFFLKDATINGLSETIKIDLVGLSLDSVSAVSICD